MHPSWRPLRCCPGENAAIGYCRRILALAIALVALADPAQVSGRSSSLTPALLDTMDGAVPALRLAGPSSGFKIDHRAIDRQNFQYGQGAERVRLRGPAGRAGEVSYAVGQAPVIDEFEIIADFFTNRPGMRLAARVVLPRSIDPSTQKPFELVVRGKTIGSGRHWERLTLEELPQQLADHARVARAQHRTALDERGAYVSHIVFLTPGGTGVTELIVDRIQVFGVVNQSNAQGKAKTASFVAPKTNPSTNPLANTNPISSGQKPRTTRRTVRIPRIIQWQGEPFEYLQSLGFNTIGIDRLPTDEELQQVDRLGLALYCPPPAPHELSAKAITAKHNSVLAWNLGDQLSADDLNHVEQWERLVARYDSIEARPTVLAPQLNALESSRISDVMLIGRPTIGTDQTLREYAAWLAQRQHLARAGTTSWTKLETQPSVRHRMQMTAMSALQPTDHPTSYKQQTALTTAAFGVKTRGFYFLSQSALDAEQSSPQRKLNVDLANRRIQLVEPWLLAGKEVGSARSTRAELSALVLQAERSHLLVPVWWNENLRAEVHPRRRGPVSFVVPGVAESSEAFLVTLGGIQRVRHRRVTGGIRVSLEELPLDGFLLLSDDQRAIAHITQYVRRIAPQATKVRRELVSIELKRASELVTTLDTLAAADAELQALLQHASGQLSACDQLIASKSFALAYLRADEVDLTLNELRSRLEQRVGGGLSPGDASVQIAPISLPAQVQLQRTLARSPLTTNLLTGGGFENLAALLEKGWRHKQLDLEGVTTAVRLSPQSPHSGSYCLELEARAIDETAPVTIVPTAPVWISSSPVQVRANDLIEITGVVRLPEPLVGSIDGLQIIDSLGGTDMALRIHEAPSWKPFRIIRAAPSDTQLSVTIALSGLGNAQVDDLAVRVIRK